MARLGSVPPTGPAEQGRKLVLTAEYYCFPINDLSVHAATFAAAEGPGEYGGLGGARKTEAKGESQARSWF